MQSRTYLIEHFQREKCDLSLVIVAVIKKSIVSNAMSGYALN